MWLANIFRHLAHASRLTPELSKVIELGTAYSCRSHHVDFLDHRRVQREDSFDALAERDLANCESGTACSTPLTDHRAFENLDAFLLTLPDFYVDPDGISGPKRGEPFFAVLLVDLFHHSCHHRAPKLVLNSNCDVLPDH